ncbi:uncharacterized protein PHALS_11480 [Plasmopara halstedii]|uniref:Uncharacterized protein n=1 Tax=Plasmopara halstedii TaxID=4781 RepID=A0A0P1A5W5_PLAHL|nr:uncharacterized protein PHALS_11480 [Plasmopara halstedii]CEG35609.1 hypothetical protein PHALS_11480 [Plasmopara halstedii]|eukprot:XP_024571978.1 hypothetical protein PHALS_11480 [Plasmopara halstedii]
MRTSRLPRVGVKRSLLQRLKQSNDVEWLNQRESRRAHVLLSQSLISLLLPVEIMRSPVFF